MSVSDRTAYFLQGGANFFVFVLDAFLLYNVLRSRKLRNQKELTTLMCLCFSDGLNCSYTTLMNAYRFYMDYQEIGSQIVSNYECPKVTGAYMFLMPHMAFSHFLFSLEKSVMVFAPMKYRFTKRNHILRLWSLGTAVLIVLVVAELIYWYHSQVKYVSIMCFVESYPSILNNILIAKRSLFYCLSVAVMLPSLYKITMLTNGYLQSRTDHQNLFTTKMTSYAGILLLTVILTLFLPDMLRVFLPSIYIQTQLIFNTLVVVKPFVNALVAFILIKSVSRQKVGSTSSVSVVQNSLKMDSVK